MAIVLWVLVYTGTGDIITYDTEYFVHSKRQFQQSLQLESRNHNRLTLRAGVNKVDSIYYLASIHYTCTYIGRPLGSCDCVG